jgi:hypothetical protein
MKTAIQDDNRIIAQTVKVPCSTLKRLKHYCVDKGMTQQDAMMAAIEEYLNRSGAGDKETND